MAEIFNSTFAFPRFSPLPYGIPDLNPSIQTDPNSGRIRCFVRGCSRMLLPPSRYKAGEYCPDHGIFCHASGTYSYRNPGRNIIVSKDVLTEGIIPHPFKFESGRFGSERGEDALTFNVLRSFQEAEALHLVASLFTGQEIVKQPRLFLWGIELTGNSLEPMELLIEARKRFESRLPVARPSTEPDLALYEPGHYIVLCEAKFTSPNPYYVRGPRKDAQSLTLDELVHIYTDATSRVLDEAKVEQADRIGYQLFRNIRFAEYMANLDSPWTVPYFVNLTRHGAENDTFEAFFRLVKPQFRNQIRHVFWEQLFALAGLTGKRLAPLQRYFLLKTEGLRPAFNHGYF